MIVFKVVPDTLWQEAVRAGRFDGAPVDHRDGYIHLSTAAQLEATLARHFGGEDGLVLVATDSDALGAELRWEPARGGDLFPHLYAALPMTAVLWTRPIGRDAEGRHVLPEGWDAA